jgi:hypothetical protein
MPIPVRWAVAAGTLVVASAALTGTPSSSAATAHPQSLHIQVTNDQPNTLDFPPVGKSPGDLYIVSGTILAPGKTTAIGRLRGTQTDIAIENGMETVSGLLTYEIGTGNELVIGGLATYPITGTGLTTGTPFVRPVLGGTGRYAGARGVATTTHLSNGLYDVVFKLTY